jgi:hypothetical protein
MGLRRALAIVGGVSAVAGCSAILGIGDLVPPEGAADGADGTVPGSTADATAGDSPADAVLEGGPATDGGDGPSGLDTSAEAPMDGSPSDAGDAASTAAVACTDAACVPANVCDLGATCEGGATSCVDLDAADPAANGIFCAGDADLVCASGACLSAEWAEWPMPNYIQGTTNVLNTKSYTSHGDGTVTDNVTGLMWQQTLSGSVETDAGPSATPYTWSDAKTYCETLTLAGYADWRMPTMIEVISLADYSQIPAVDLSAFPDTPATGSDYFWVSTLVPNDTSSAGVVTFYNGGEGSGAVSATYYVRCVR